MARIRTNSSTIDLGGGKVVFSRVDESLVVSEKHRAVKGVWQSGGPFYQVTDRRVPTPSGRITGSANVFGVTSKFDGRIVPAGAPLSPLSFRAYPTFGSESSVASGHGATGFKRARPGQPKADIATFIGELREGLPAIPLRLYRQLRGFRGAGSEYLNAQFGWLPMVRDIQKMYETYRDLEKLLQQLIRDNGRGIRRRRELVNSTTVSSVTNTSSSGSAFAGCYPQPFWTAIISGSSRSITDTIEQEHVWFAGRFRYYIPDVGTSQWRRRATRALFGVNPTPEVLWNLLPWSWLIDWFGNVGDVMSNLASNAAENCVADYAFVMRERTTLKQTVCTGSWNARLTNGYNVPAGSYECRLDDQITRKVRVGADPYGFNFGFDGLSAYQASILAALGVSRR